MAQIINDYNASKIDDDIQNGVDFLIEHDESRLVIEIPKGFLNMVLRKSDGVMMHTDQESTLENYLDIIAESKNKTHALAYARLSGSMLKTGLKAERGMKGTNIQALLAKGPFNLKNIDDADIQAEYFSSEPT